MPGRSISTIWQSNPVIYAPARYKRACRYESFIPDQLGTLDLHLPAEVAGLVSEAEAAIRGLNTSWQPALAPLARLLLRTEAIASSKVEGLQMDTRDLARAEARMEAGGRKTNTALEILSNIAAMETAITEAAAVPRFGEEQILGIHRRLMQHDATHKIDGRFRTDQNWIGGNDYNPCGADFVPPPVDELPSLVNDLCEAVNGEVLSPVVQAALVHAQFETIHPFDDGNGRTGRALIHVILRRRGVSPDYVSPISVVLAAARHRYIAGLTSFRGDGVIDWIEHFAAAAAQSAHLARRYLDEVEILMATWREKLGATAAPRADAAAWAIIALLPAHPVIAAPVAITATGRSRGPVYEAMKQLEDADVLIPLSQTARNRSWEAAGLLDLLAAFEDGAAVP